MIIPDVNLLIYAYNSGDKRHASSKAWLGATLASTEQLCLTWHTIWGFLRITTTKGLFGAGFTTSEAISIVDEWLSFPNIVVLAPTAEHFRIFKNLVFETNISGAILMDAHLAAIAIEHGATLATTDRNFRIFDGLKLINPLK